MAKVLEGSAEIKLGNNTFYNTKMKGLRDLSVLFLNAMELKRYSLLDSTAATGIRGIRYRLEAGAGEITLLDINKKAFGSIKANLKANRVKASAINKSIQEFCNTEDRSFDVIDLDPFGTAAPYIYDLMKVAHDKTVLMVTCTDTAVLCGANPLACYKTYGSMPMHNELCHEAGTRILLNFIAKIASQFNFGIEVRLAIANLHYIRVFLTLKHGAAEAVESVRKTGFASFCSKCRSYTYAMGLAPKLERKCKNCGTETFAFGPMWLGGIYDDRLIREMMKIAPKEMDSEALKLLKKIDSELDIPFFYSVPKLTRQLRIGAVSHIKVIEKLKKKYLASETHFDLNGVKTDAPTSQVLKCVMESLVAT